MDELLNSILIGAPEGIENMQLPNPTLRDYYRDELDRIFWLNGNVECGAEDLIRMILRCNKEDKGIPTEDRRPIKIFIDSPGGDAVFMWTIINLIKISKTKIITINYCSAASAAAEILAAGHERLALPGTHVMIHTGSCAYVGQADVVESTKKHFDKMNKKITDTLLANTGIDPKVYKKKASKDWYMDEEEALANGVIDRIVTDLEEIF